MTKRIILLAGAAFALHGCGAPAANDQGANAGAGNAAAPGVSGEKATPADEAAAHVSRLPAAAEVQTRIVGRWSRDAHCGRVVEFRDGGVMTTFDGTPGTWTVDADGAPAMLHMRGQGRGANMAVDVIADTEIHLRDTDPQAGGATLALRRC